MLPSDMLCLQLFLWIPCKKLSRVSDPVSFLVFKLQKEVVANTTCNELLDFLNSFGCMFSVGAKGEAIVRS